MSGTLVGLVLGAGLFCIWWSFWPAASPTAPRRSLLAGPAAWARDELATAGVRSVSPRSLLMTCCAVFALATSVVTLATRVPAIGLCFGAMAGWAPFALVRVRARRRRAVLRDAWPEAVDNLASGVRAGLSLPEALGQLAVHGPTELRGAFGRFAEDYRATGRFADCLDRLKEQLADPVGDRLVEALRIAREVGGSDLGRLLRTLSTFLREDARTRGELETRQSWTVNGARLAVAAPWLVLALLATRPTAVAAYARPAGALVLAVGAVSSLVAYRAMIRIGRLPAEQRVLR
jgi:tight adherence protein B